MVVPTENRDFFVEMKSFAAYLESLVSIERAEAYSDPDNLQDYVQLFNLDELIKSKGPLVFDFCLYLSYYRYVSMDGSQLEIRPRVLPVVISMCDNLIKEYDRNEEDRNLDNELKRNTLKTARQAREISIWATVIAFFAALGTIAQGIGFFISKYP